MIMALKFADRDNNWLKLLNLLVIAKNLKKSFTLNYSSIKSS